MRRVRSAGLPGAHSAHARWVHGVFAQRPRPKGHGQNSTIKISCHRPVRQTPCLMCRVIQQYLHARQANASLLVRSRR